LIFNDAVRYYREHESQLLALQSNPTLKPITELLRERDDFVRSSKSEFVKNRLSYRLHSFIRRHHSGFKKVTFGLFKVSGSLIAELRTEETFQAAQTWRRYYYAARRRRLKPVPAGLLAPRRALCRHSRCWRKLRTRSQKRRRLVSTASRHLERRCLRCASPKTKE